TALKLRSCKRSSKRMASAFCCSELRLFRVGQLMFATVAIHAPRNSRLTSGKTTGTDTGAVTVFTGAFLTAPLDPAPDFELISVCCVAQETTVATVRKRDSLRWRIFI